MATASLLDQVRADAIAAIDRLLAGAPENAKLREAALSGKLQVNPTTVAIESGRSRTYFGFRDCLLPDVRQRILEAKTSTGRAVALRALATGLQAQVRKLEEEIKVRDSAIVALRVALIQARGRDGSRGNTDVADFRASRRDKTKR